MSKLAALAQQLQRIFAPILPKGLVNIEPEHVMTMAEKATGLSDWGPPSFREGLDKAIFLYKRDVPHDYKSRYDFRIYLFTLGVIRLRIVNTLNKNPEILEVPLERPLVIAAYPRTGTTILQNLLALDPNAKILKFWEAMLPSPPPDPETYENDPRIKLATQLLGEFHEKYPIWKIIHNATPEGPQECEVLFSYEFASPLFYARYPMIEFMNWIGTRDMSEAYRFYRMQLQMLSWKFPGKRWLLKGPMHLPCIRGLMDVFPDASVVVTHRDPERVLGSILSLISNTRKTCNAPKALDFEQLGQEFLEGMPQVMENYLGFRKEVSPANFLDLDYRDTVKDPLGQVKRVYDHFSYEWPENFEDTIKEFMENNRKDKHGKHSYSVTDFGLTKDQVYARFKPYFDAYPQFFSDLGK